MPHVLNEVNISSNVQHPFILHHPKIAMDSQVIYIFNDYMKYGNLTNVMNHQTRMNKNEAIFFSAQVVLCLEYLHSMNVVFRDLKMDNILLQESGFIKLTDFGFSKTLFKWQRTYTLCGTPEYMAPEIILKQGYNHQVDFWALGIVLYEMLYGRTPFLADDP